MPRGMAWTSTVASKAEDTAKKSTRRRGEAAGAAAQGQAKAKAKAAGQARPRPPGTHDRETKKTPTDPNPTEAPTTHTHTRTQFFPSESATVEGRRYGLGLCYIALKANANSTHTPEQNSAKTCISFTRPGPDWAKP